MSSDRETTRRVRSWLEAGVTAIPDHLLDAVLDEIPTTPQRRPLWPVRRYAEMSTYARLGAVAAAVIVVVVAGTAFMLGRGVGSEASPSPPPSSPVPTSTAPTTGGAVLPEFTACLPGNSMSREGTNETEVVSGPNGDVTVEKERGTTYKGTITATDPRFSGTHYYIWTGNAYSLTSGGQGPASYADGQRIENDDGAWQGNSFGVELPDGTQQRSVTVLIGEGAYEGLTAVLLVVDGSCFFNFRGLVMEVPDPPVPYTGE